MTRSSACFLLGAALFAAGLLHGPAWAEETLLWSDRSSGGLVALAYGSPDPMKNPLFMLSCFNDMNIAVLNVHRDVAGTAPGDPVSIELAAGDAKAEIDGEAARDDVNKINYAEASDIALAPVIAVLRAAGPVTLTMGETSATLSEHGRADAVAKFDEDCLLK